jgi:hypothetical protein
MSAREDIIVAIKNAVERGYSLEQAKQVLINSGYNINDINEAYSYITGGASGSSINSINEASNLQDLSALQKSSQIPQLPQIPQPPASNEYSGYKPLPSEQQIKQKKPFPWLVILLSGILITLIILLILMIIFKDNIAALIQNWFG